MRKPTEKLICCGSFFGVQSVASMKDCQDYLIIIAKSERFVKFDFWHKMCYYIGSERKNQVKNEKR